MKIQLTYTTTFSFLVNTDNAGYTQPDNIDSILREENYWLNNGNTTIEDLMQNADNLTTSISGKVL